MLPPRSSFEVDYRLRQRLLTEGSEARLFGAARFSDGPTQLSNPDPTPHPNPTPTPNPNFNPNPNPNPNPNLT